MTKDIWDKACSTVILWSVVRLPCLYAQSFKGKAASFVFYMQRLALLGSRPELVRSWIIAFSVEGDSGQTNGIGLGCVSDKIHTICIYKQ